MALIIAGYEIDVELSADLSVSNTVTEYPVEEGVSVVDHVRAQPVRLHVEGVVSNTPIGALAQRRAQFALIGGEAFAFPADEARAHLLAVNEAREPVSVECSHGTFDNMVMESFEPTSTTDDCLHFTASFVQIKFVTNERTTVRVKARAKKVNRGHRPSIEAPDAPPPSGAATQMATAPPDYLLR